MPCDVAGPVLPLSLEHQESGSQLLDEGLPIAPEGTPLFSGWQKDVDEEQASEGEEDEEDEDDDENEEDEDEEDEDEEDEDEDDESASENDTDDEEEEEQEEEEDEDTWSDSLDKQDAASNHAVVECIQVCESEADESEPDDEPAACSSSADAQTTTDQFGCASSRRQQPLPAEPSSISELLELRGGAQPFYTYGPVLRPRTALLPPTSPIKTPSAAANSTTPGATSSVPTPQRIAGPKNRASSRAKSSASRQIAATKTKPTAPKMKSARRRTGAVQVRARGPAILRA